MAEAPSRRRMAAFGILPRGDDIALVRITLADGTPPFLDLPGGAIDGEETARDAVAREFGEETGLRITPGAVIGHARQHFLTREAEPVNNHCTFFAVGDAAGVTDKVEDDHELVWMTPEAALARVRHDAHAWAICAWLRSNR